MYEAFKQGETIEYAGKGVVEMALGSYIYKDNEKLTIFKLLFNNCRQEHNEENW